MQFDFGLVNPVPAKLETFNCEVSCLWSTLSVHERQEGLHVLVIICPSYAHASDELANSRPRHFASQFRQDFALIRCGLLAERSSPFPVHNL